MFSFIIFGAITALFAMIGPKHLFNRLISGLIGLFLGGLLGYFILPTLAWNYAEISFLAIVGAAVGIVVSMAEAQEGSPSRASGYTLLGAVTWLFVMPFFTSFAGLPGKAEKYRGLLGDVSVSEFSDDMSPVDIGSVRTVSQDLAKLLGEKRLGEIAGLGSRVNLGIMNIQAIDGCFTVQNPEGVAEELCFDNELFWAGPLIHSGIFKQWGNGSTPGYVLVSATDPSDVKMVTAVVRKNTSFDRIMPDMEIRTEVASMGLRYLNRGGYFRFDLRRHLRHNGYLTVGLADPVFEVRDDGTPFWVVTKFEKRVGFSGRDATGVIVVNTQSGDIKDYSIAEAPSWIDRIQPHTFVSQQLDWWGELVHGWWNFANKDKITSTRGISLVFGEDGHAYWYTGLQSVGSDAGTMGFALVNSRTKEARWYRVTGATETAAVLAAQNARGVKEAGYKGSNAILYNVANIPTYFTVLHGNNGLSQMYAFVSVEDYSIVGVGQTPRQALRDYQVKLSSSHSVNADDLVDRATMNAVVAAVAVESEGGKQTYYFLLQGHEGKEFYASSNVSIELKWTRTGDNIELIVNSGEGASVNIIRFNNLSLDLEG